MSSHQRPPAESAFRRFDEGGVFVIAEIGGNHEGDFAVARHLLELAATSGADAVKFQVYTPDTLVNREQSRERHRHFRGFALSLKQYKELAVMAGVLGVQFMASIWNRGLLAELDPFVAVHKIGSGDFNAYEIVEATVRTGKPIIQSCGLASMDDVEAYVRFVESLDPSYISDGKLCLMQCTVAYPSTDREANLAAMLQMSDRTGLPVGYSDHTFGTYAAEIAVAMGAQVIELHFTDDRAGKTFRDHEISVTRDEMRGFAQRVRKIKELQGSYEKKLTSIELATDHLVSFRRGVYPARDLEAGTVLERADLTSLRPNVGIDGREYFEVLGRRLKVDKKALERLDWDDLEP